MAAMKSGAHDYIIKGNLKRLLPAIDRELREARERRERRRAEDNLRLVHDVAMAVAEAPDVHAALGRGAAPHVRRPPAARQGRHGCRRRAAIAWNAAPPGIGIGPRSSELRRVSQTLKLGPGTGLPGTRMADEAADLAGPIRDRRAMAACRRTARRWLHRRGRDPGDRRLAGGGGARDVRAQRRPAARIASSMR